MLRRHPDSAVALYLLGRAEEGRGDDEEALRLYQAAVEQFDLQCPDSYERPEVVIQRIVDLQRKLALRGG